MSRTEQLHGVTDQELALLIASQRKGNAKDAGDILKVEDLEAYAVWSSARCRRGQSLHDWIVYSNRPPLETEAEDGTVVTSSKQMVSKLIRLQDRGAPRSQISSVNRRIGCPTMYPP